MSQFHALIIDDNLQNLQVLGQMLAKQGISSTEISDPATLPGLWQTLERVDVVFLDLEMPGVDGFDVKDMVRAHFGEVPIIAYTVHISEINVAKQSGFDGFLGKPLNKARFPDQVARILRGEAVWDRA